MQTLKPKQIKYFMVKGGIKSVGYEAISNILKERDKNGKFKSITDFINRVDPKDANKLQLEGLVKAGVFDELDDNRKKIFTSIPKIIQTIKSKYEDRVGNQTNLFGTKVILRMKILNLIQKKRGQKKNCFQKNLKL